MLLPILFFSSCLWGSFASGPGTSGTSGPKVLDEHSDRSDDDDEPECKLSGHKDLHLLSPATACCYGKIVKNTSCCMDQEIASGVTRKTIQRPEMHWDCNDDNCYDTLTGPRGRDSFWLPEGASCSTPRTLYTHGGSWMFGSPDTDSYAQLGSRLAKVTGTVVMLTDYPLVPAGNYSSILKWSISALQWLSKHGPFEGCKEKVPLFVGGDSSGGGTTMSLVLTLAKRPDLLDQELAGAFFFSPWTNLMCNTPEYYSNAFSKIQGVGKFQDDSKLTMYTGDILFQEVTPANAGAFNGNAVEYLGGDFQLQTDPVASPFFAQPVDFSGRVPPLYFAVGASESILGDSVRVAQHAAQGGVDVILEVYHGMWHVFPMYSEGCGLGEPLWAGEYAINQTGLFVRHIHQTGRLPYKLKLEGPEGGPPESSILAKFWRPGHSKVPFFRYLYDPNVVFGLTMGTCGMQMIRMSELKKKEEKFRESRKLFLMGMALNVLLGPLLDVAGYAFAAAAVLAPFTGFNIVRHFAKVGELLPNRDKATSYKDIMKNLAKQSPWIVLPSVTGAALGIFLLGFCLGGVTEYSGERAVRRFVKVRQYRRREDEWQRAGSAPDLTGPLLDSHALNGATVQQRLKSRRPSFIQDFVRGVPEVQLPAPQ